MKKGALLTDERAETGARTSPFLHGGQGLYATDTLSA
jgi:hypothetical protein